MKNKIIIILLLLFPLMYSQPSRLLYQEINTVPSEKGQTVYYTFKIPYNRIVFEKNGSAYKAGFQISIEAVDNKFNSYSRQIKNYTLSAQSYEETNSDDRYKEGLLQLDIPDGEYSILPIITDLNSRTELKLPLLPVKSYEKSDTLILEPLVVETGKADCGGASEITAANAGGGIPYGEKEYNLLIPIKNGNADSIFVRVYDNEDTLYSGSIERSGKHGFKLRECENKIIIDAEGEEYSYYYLTGISDKLQEGDVTISIADNEDSKKKIEFSKHINWFDKPLSAADAEFGIRSLKLIETEDNIKVLLKNDEEDYQKVLYEYWRKYDNDTSSAYNPLMKQYYDRVDYALRNFRTITGKSGLNSDRGKIYVRFGAPDDIDRSSNSMGDVLEIWSYNNQNNKFIFVDKQGTGDFLLKES